MLNKNFIMDLLKDNEYAKIADYFSSEYKEILENFLLKNNIQVSDDDSMIDIIYKVEINFPKYSGLMMLLSRTLYDEDVTPGDRIEKLIDNYNLVKEQLT